MVGDCYVVMAESITQMEIVIQFLSLFIPAVIALIGSYCLYIHRQRRKKRALKSAIRTEIESADRLEHISNYLYDKEKIPYSAAVSTSVFEGHSFELGLLDSTARKAVVDYYSNAIILNKMIESATNFKSNDIEIPDHEHDNMRWQVKRVRGTRKSALIHLDSDKVPEDTDFD